MMFSRYFYCAIDVEWSILGSKGLVSFNPGHFSGSKMATPPGSSSSKVVPDRLVRTMRGRKTMASNQRSFKMLFYALLSRFLHDLPGFSLNSSAKRRQNDAFRAFWSYAPPGRRRHAGPHRADPPLGCRTRGRPDGCARGALRSWAASSPTHEDVPFLYLEPVEYPCLKENTILFIANLAYVPRPPFWSLMAVSGDAIFLHPLRHECPLDTRGEL